MRELLSRGTNGDTPYTPLPGVSQVMGSSRLDLPFRVSVPDKPVAIYAVVVATAAAAIASATAATGYSLGNVWIVAVLAATAAIAEKQRVWLTKDTEASITFIPILFAAVLFGPLAAMIVSAISMVAQLGQPYMKWAIYTCTRSITGALSGFAAAAAIEAWSHDLAGLAMATVIGAVVCEVGEIGFVALTSKVRGHRPLDVVGMLAPVAFASALLYAPVVGLLIAAYEEISPVTLPLFLAPALAAQRLFGLYQDQRRLAEDLASANVRLERANLSFATALVATLDARDQYTAGHSAAVAIYARDIAARLGLSEEEQQIAHLCGLVHDIGKIGLPAGLLEKPGPLTLEERRQMEKHSEIGERILAKVEDYAEIAKIVRHHHERWDGQGYPDGIAGEDIPLIARIIAVADAYNAMTSDRPYRDAMPSRVARLRLAQGVESQFDTTVVAAFEAILAGASETYRLGSRPDFTLEEQDTYSEPAAAVA